MKILTIIGARPQFVKAAVVSRAISRWNKQGKNPIINEIIVHTGQHYDHQMSDIFFREMKIPQPQYNLGIGGSSHGVMTGRMLEEIEKILNIEKPDILQVYGDTNSTLAGALAAAKIHIPIAHVESGLRSFNMNMPEEINRILTDQLSTFLFTPTDIASKNLDLEGFKNRHNISILQVGDVMYDAVLFYQNIAQPTSTIQSLIDSLDNSFYLSTIHRAENTDSPQKFHDIMQALNTISLKKSVILPLHPRAKKSLEHCDYADIHIIDPVGYFDMITLLSRCQGVFTDSGGLQKEAYFFRKPCVTLRDETEWVELVQQGYNTLVGANYEAILEAEKTFLSTEIEFKKMLYGNGDAATKIVDHLAKHFIDKQ